MAMRIKIRLHYLFILTDPDGWETLGISYVDITAQALAKEGLLNRLIYTPSLALAPLVLAPRFADCFSGTRIYGR
jgi:hypothetical protein